MVHVLLVTLGRAVGLGQVGAAQDWSPCESQLTFCGAKGYSREGQCDDSGHCCFLQALPPGFPSGVERFSPLFRQAVLPGGSVYQELF